MNKINGLVTRGRLRAMLAYDLRTGTFVWRVKPTSNVEVGAIAGSVKPRGDVVICIDGRRYRAHRLAFLYMTGRFPRHEVDHIDGNPNNNAWSNLRQATRSQNHMNMPGHAKSGYKGVRKHVTGKWHARIKKNGREYSLGYFWDVKDAASAYNVAASELFGTFAYGG